ncbi:hypothetical protein BDC45DRAFT_609680 [Circinella umbellata]|nr:hypothetical protein BDC45DRAFT_609680 [Circinella umbellata]
MTLFSTTVLRVILSLSIFLLGQNIILASSASTTSPTRQEPDLGIAPGALLDNCVCMSGDDQDFTTYNGRLTRQCCDKNEVGFYFTTLDFCTHIEPGRQTEYGDCCATQKGGYGLCSGPLPAIIPRT